MKRLALILPFALAAVLLAQQPSKKPTPSTSSSKSTPQAAPKTTTEQTTTAPDEGELENVPDQNIDPSGTTPPPPADVNQQKAAVASIQKAIPSGSLSLATSLGKNILVVRVNGRDVKAFPVSVGVKAHQTPQGHFGIRHIVWNPSWHPPKAAWAKGKQAAGPASASNPMKVVKIFFQEPDYYIHGTDHEDKLGAAASHGCIRMSQA